MNIPFTQTKEYLKWHEAVDTKTFYKEFFQNINGEEKKVAICSSIIINLRIGKVLYVPYGPTIFPSPAGEGLGVRPELSKEILDYLQDLAQKENCVFVRLEENNENKFFSGEINRTYTPTKNIFSLFSISNKLFLPAKKTFAKEGIFQPRTEWWLNLNETEENILNNFHKDHRYSIRRAEKEIQNNNLQKEIINLDENLSGIDREKYFLEFWKLLKETGERDDFSLYEENYYRQIFANNEMGESVKKFLVFTKLENKFMSVALIVISDKIANLVFAGSVSEKRELGFNHLMQWETIKYAKSLGCEIYNFGGITEEVNGQVYGRETLQGVTNFKKRFGGFTKFHGDFVDLPIKKIRYFLYILKKMI